MNGSKGDPSFMVGLYLSGNMKLCGSTNEGMAISWGLQTLLLGNFPELVDRLLTKTKCDYQREGSCSDRCLIIHNPKLIIMFQNCK